MKDTVFNQKIEIKHTEPTVEIDLAEFEKVINSRRSVRVFKDEKLPKEVIEKAIDHGLLAPNSSNLQPWEFHWVRSDEVKKELAKNCFNQNGARTASDLIVCVARTDTWKKHCKDTIKAFESLDQEVPKVVREYYTKLAPTAYGMMGPFGIFSPIKWLFFNIMGLFQVVPREPIWPWELKTWAVKTTALACENIMLSLRAQGYDSLPMEGFDRNRVKRLLKLHRHQHPVMVIACGKRDESGIYGPRMRFDRSKFIKFY